MGGRDGGAARGIGDLAGWLDFADAPFAAAMDVYRVEEYSRLVMDGITEDGAPYYPSW